MCRALIQGGRRCHGRHADGGAPRRARAAQAQARYRARTIATGQTSTEAFLDAVAAATDPAKLAAGWDRQLRTLRAAGIDTTEATAVAEAALTAWRASTAAPGAPTGHGTVRGAHEHRRHWRTDPDRVTRSATAELARAAVDAAVRDWVAEQTALLDAADLAEAARRVHAVKNTDALTEEELAEARRTAEERTARIQAESAAERAAGEARRREEGNIRAARELAQHTIRSRYSTDGEKAEARAEFTARLDAWAAEGDPSAAFVDELTDWARRDRTVRPAWLVVRTRQLGGDEDAAVAAQAELGELTRRRRG